MDHHNDPDFLSLSLSLGTWTMVPLPPDAASELPDLSYLSSSPSISPSPSTALELNPVPFHQQSDVQGLSDAQNTPVGDPSHHQHAPLKVPSYHQLTPLGNPSYHKHTPLEVDPQYLQGTMIGLPLHHQRTPIGVPPHHQGTPIGGPLPHQGTTLIRGPSPHQITTIRGPPHLQGTADLQGTVVGGLQHNQPVGGPPYHQPIGAPPHHQSMAVEHSTRKNRTTRRTCIRLKPGKSKTIPPPYPWATDRRAILHDLQYIQSKGINTITGTVKCTECNQQFDIEYDLLRKFKEVQRFVIENKDTMSQRAPEEWNSPPKLDCRLCNQKNCVKPIFDKKRSINWLFLLLGQLIGSCKLAELKYFCKHTSIHRTGAKDRLLYSTYLELCRQLDPKGLYDL